MHKYQRIAADLRNAIVDGAYPVGSPLPVVDDLSQAFECNGNTVRSALRILLDQGMISQRQGSRTVVISAKPVAVVPGAVIGVRRWDAGDVDRELARLQQSTQGLRDSLHTRGYLPPGAMARLPEILGSAMIHADRLYQQKLVDEARHRQDGDQ
ncbi:MAG: GntR family transcriptional regulator [Mycobacterium sp.]